MFQRTDIGSVLDDQIDDVPETHIGETPVAAGAIWGLALYMASLALFLGYTLICFWPTAANAAPGYLGWRADLDPLARMFVLVSCSGALGSQVHAIRSLTWYVGNRALYASWVLKYMMLPMLGASLGLILYIVARSALFVPQSDFAGRSTFGFVAAALLVGLFADQALEKLRRVGDALLSESPRGKNALEADRIRIEQKRSAAVRDLYPLATSSDSMVELDEDLKRSARVPVRSGVTTHSGADTHAGAHSGSTNGSRRAERPAPERARPVDSAVVSAWRRPELPETEGAARRTSQPVRRSEHYAQKRDPEE